MREPARREPQPVLGPPADTSPAPAAPSRTEDDALRQQRMWVTWLVVAAVLLALGVLLGLRWISYHATHVSTDDAFLDAPVVTLSTGVAGHVNRVLVRSDSYVRRGQLLVELDPRQMQAQVDQARALWEQARLKAEGLNAAGRAGGRMKLQLQASQEQVKQARAALDQAKLALSQTRLYAPAEGRITRISVQPGANVQAGQPLMALVRPEIFVMANFKETDVGRIQPGQHVSIRVDAYPRSELAGTVTSIQAGTSSRFSLIPSENAQSNYVKVVQRVPVRIDLNEPPPRTLNLAPGMSVVPTVRVP